MSFSEAQYREMFLRVERNKKREPLPESCSKSPELEMELHDEIIDYCMAQWPRWKYIRARPDKPSGIQKGAQDFTLFLPGGKTVCVECKRRTGKLDDDQLIWRKEMEMLGHVVHLVRSMEEFLKVVS